MPTVAPCSAFCFCLCPSLCDIEGCKEVRGNAQVCALSLQAEHHAWVLGSELVVLLLIDKEGKTPGSSAGRYSRSLGSSSDTSAPVGRPRTPFIAPTVSFKTSCHLISLERSSITALPQDLKRVHLSPTVFATWVWQTSAKTFFPHTCSSSWSTGNFHAHYSSSSLVFKDSHACATVHYIMLKGLSGFAGSEGCNRGGLQGYRHRLGCRLL